MNKHLLFTLVAVASLNGMASAQVVTGPIITSYRPIAEQEPIVTYSPVIESAPTTANYGSVVTYSPVIPPATTVYSQAPIIVARPIVQPTTTYAPAPVITYRPVAPTYYAAPTPVITYRPPVIAYAPALPVYGATTYSTYPVVPTVVARPVIVSPKVYVPGQPIRNVLRAITP